MSDLELEPDEGVLWTGSPTPVPPFGRQGRVPAFTFFCAAVALSGLAAHLSGSAIAGVGIGIPVAAAIAVGQYVTVTRLWNNTRFYLTNRRVAVVISNNSLLAKLTTRSVPLTALGAPRVELRPDADDIVWIGGSSGLLKIWFDVLAYPSWPDPPMRTAFFLVQNGEGARVCEATAAAISAAAPELPLNLAGGRGGSSL